MMNLFPEEVRKRKWRIYNGNLMMIIKNNKNNVTRGQLKSCALVFGR
jgi:hypothetical protein